MLVVITGCRSSSLVRLVVLVLNSTINLYYNYDDKSGWYTISWVPVKSQVLLCQTPPNWFVFFSLWNVLNNGSLVALLTERDQLISDRDPCNNCSLPVSCDLISANIPTLHIKITMTTLSIDDARQSNKSRLSVIKFMELVRTRNRFNLLKGIKLILSLPPSACP